MLCRALGHVFTYALASIVPVFVFKSSSHAGQLSLNDISGIIMARSNGHYLNKLSLYYKLTSIPASPDFLRDRM